MHTRLALAVIASVLALTACDESANKPKAAAPAGGSLVGPRSAVAASTANKPAGPRTATPAPAPATGTLSGTATAAGATPPPAAPAPAPKPEAPKPVVPKADAPKPEAPKPAIPKATEPAADVILKHTETDSGLIMDDFRFGDGAEAKPHQTVTMHCRGSLADGSEFYSSYKAGKPDTFSLDKLVKGWQEGVPGMKVGGKRRLIVPPELGYGKQEVKGPNGQVLVPSNSMLIFEIELFDVK